MASPYAPSPNSLDSVWVWEATGQCLARWDLDDFGSESARAGTHRTAVCLLPCHSSLHGGILTTNHTTACLLLPSHGCYLMVLLPQGSSLTIPFPNHTAAPSWLPALSVRCWPGASYMISHVVPPSISYIYQFPRIALPSLAAIPSQGTHDSVMQGTASLAMSRIRIHFENHTHTFCTFGLRQLHSSPSGEIELSTCHCNAKHLCSPHPPTKGCGGFLGISLGLYPITMIPHGF